jgi:hypothetical protein
MTTKQEHPGRTDHDCTRARFMLRDSLSLRLIRARWAAAGATPFVHEPLVRDRGGPGTELLLRAGEGLQSGEHFKEHLTGEIVRLGGTMHLQITGDDRREIGVQALERTRRAGPRRVENRVKVLAERQGVLLGSQK